MLEKPQFTLENFIRELKHLGQLSKDVLVKEFLQTLACLVLPSINDKTPKHTIKDRLQTIYISFKYFIIASILLPLKYGLFFTTSIIEAAFDMISLTLILGFMAFQIPFGIALNALFLLINNLLIHTTLLGIMSHSICLCFALIGSPFDHYARLKLCEYGNLLLHDLRSLYEVIITLIHPKHLFNTLIGFRYLNMGNLDDHLQVNQPDHSPQWFLGLYSAIPKALGETFEVLYRRLQSLGQHLLFMLSTPIFLILSLFEAGLHATQCAEKAALSPVIWLMGRGQAMVSDTFIEKTCFEDCPRSPLLV